jgi:hypothetical protein
VRRLKAAVLFLILSVWYNHIMSKTIRKKRGDTLVKTIEKKYGVDLGYRSDAQLHTVLKKEGLPSLSKLLKMTKKS